MSAPQIPNLNTLRRNTPKSLTRDPNTPVPQRRQIDKDAIIRSTDNDAAQSRLSAINAGYLDDPFAALLSSHSEEPARRLPLMNRGTYVRQFAIDALVARFIGSQGGGRVQIVSLGAGSDSRYFRLVRGERGLRERLRYVEVDFGENTRGKIERVRGKGFGEVVRRECGFGLGEEEGYEVVDGGIGLRSSGYCVCAGDLRSLGAEQGGRERGWEAEIDTTVPTLLISECCLCYLSPSDADAVLAYFSRLFAPAQDTSTTPTPSSPLPSRQSTTSSTPTSPATPLAIIIYEPILPHTPFGRTMISNLTARGIQMQTLEKYSDLNAQKRRLVEFGFTSESPISIAVTRYTGSEGAGGSFGPNAMDLDSIYKQWVPRDEKERVEALEWMDEVEEFELLGRHYCVAWGGRGF